MNTSSDHSIALVTYSNTNVRDVWIPYLGQLEKHLRGIKSYVFLDEDRKNDNFHTFKKYDNNDPYFEQYLGCLSTVEEDFIIYSQEDFIVYDNISSSNLQQYCNFLLDTDYSFVRLIRAGYNTPLNHKISDNLFEVDIRTNDAFSMQATLWKKDKLAELYSHVKSELWYEGDNWNSGCRDLSTKGAFAYFNEPKRGKFHYDSSVFPYICTALNKGLWNLNEYPKILGDILESYGIDPAERGYRQYYGQTRS